MGNKSCKNVTPEINFRIFVFDSSSTEKKTIIRNLTDENPSNSFSFGYENYKVTINVFCEEENEHFDIHLQVTFSTFFILLIVDQTNVQSLAYVQSKYQQIKEMQKDNENYLLLFTKCDQVSVLPTEEVTKLVKNVGRTNTFYLKEEGDFSTIRKDLINALKKVISNENQFAPCMKKPIIILYDEISDITKAKYTECITQLSLNTSKLEIGETFPKFEVLRSDGNNTTYQCTFSYLPRGKQNCTLLLNDKEVEYLFWEGKTTGKIEGKEIFVNDINEFCFLLEKLGLDIRERNDFIVYWLKELIKYKKIGVLLINEEYEKAAKLEVSGFDKQLRVVIGFFEADGKDIDNVDTIKKVERPTGKYIVEWGAFVIEN
ncbi:hypothetical protein EIN_432440 [Entamoeba invadens IP1]|uniref:Uncharacterized protein n=1 Tax=Entamoeba invadens IP1 TaxID=370355 RepID=A0A0A1UGV0_ENTIV|nr:hypothetical protein EIN_432440 [Entamoeba invadens IP1]ELP93702.1 hypothetical protein EIN_432440 [Entamoeba invadens IP1]|eukprot:XP_004260473.1 hypothetical protein EIN_432440 [Entamoeba invadens IP1]